MIFDPKAYAEATDAVMAMTGPELLTYLDSMYGRENLPRSCTIEEIRSEALAQTERRYGEDYERILLSKKNAFSALVRGRGDVETNKTEEDES